MHFHSKYIYIVLAHTSDYYTNTLFMTIFFAFYPSQRTNKLISLHFIYLIKYTLKDRKKSPCFALQIRIKYTSNAMLVSLTLIMHE